MKNFARILDLGTVDCVCYRQSFTEINYVFWLRSPQGVMSPSCLQDYHHASVVDELFGHYEYLLREAAEKVYGLVLHQMALHEDQFKSDGEVRLDGATLANLYSSEG